VLGNRLDGIAVVRESTNNTIKSNTVKGNGRSGIAVFVTSTANLIVSNTAQENGLDLEDQNLNCDANVWRHNNFTTANQSCID